MTNFSNLSFIRAITPQASQGSSQSSKLLGLFLAGLSTAAVLLLYQYYHYSKQIKVLEKRNEMLAILLDAASAVAEERADNVDEETAIPEEDI